MMVHEPENGIRNDGCYDHHKQNFGIVVPANNTAFRMDNMITKTTASKMILFAYRTKNGLLDTPKPYLSSGRKCVP